MRIFDGHNDWTLRIGEVKINDLHNNITCSLVVGFVSDEPSKIYFRLYNDSDHLIIGTWYVSFSTPGYIENVLKGSGISLTMIDIIKRQIVRLEALKAFV